MTGDTEARPRPDLTRPGRDTLAGWFSHFGEPVPESFEARRIPQAWWWMLEALPEGQMELL